MPNLVEFNGRTIDLDAHRRERAARVARGRDIPWRVTRSQYLHFCDLLAQLEGLAEGTDPYSAVVEEMKSIPGYPLDLDQDHDTLCFVITDSTPSTRPR